MADQTIYIFSNGVLERRGNTLCLNSEEEKKYLPVETVGSILAFGEISVNKRVLELLSKQEILLHYFNYYGYYMGTFYPREHYNSGYMILRQAEYYMDMDKRLVLAKAFVKGAIGNMVRVMRYYLNRGKDLEEVLEQIDQLAGAVESCNTINELMAIEGNVRNWYYKGFDQIINDPEFQFESRTRRPPQNKLNVLISFANSLVYATVLSEIYKTHLDPRIGYLHSTNNRRFSLNLDVAEIFKPILADRLIFSTIGHRIIQKTSFDQERKGLLLKESARKKFVQAFDERLAETIQHNKLNRKVSYRELIRLELYKLQKHFMGEGNYTPFIARW